MQIRDKILMDREGLEEHGPITIVAFGASVTHGALRKGEFNYESVYWNVLRKKILEIRDYVPVNVINAGIGGQTAIEALQRMEKQVLLYQPDLIIVDFGGNDINGELSVYVSSLKTIFEKCKKSGAEVIFMTQSMFNTYVAEDTLEELKDYAAVTAEYQNSGKVERFVRAAKELAKEMEVEVCDCYAKWKELSQSQDITLRLINRINHPEPEIHEMYADMLFSLIFRKSIENIPENSSAMYKAGEK